METIGQYVTIMIVPTFLTKFCLSFAPNNTNLGVPKSIHQLNKNSN